VELADRELAEDAHAFLGMVIEEAAGLGATLALGVRLKKDDANGVDIAVFIEAGVGALHIPVVRSVKAAMTGRIFIAGISSRNCSGTDDAVRIALTLVETRGAGQTVGRSFGQMLGELAVVG